MGIIKLGNPVSPEFEFEVKEGAKKDSLLVRPCERYEEFYKNCKSIKGRVHQYYVYGEIFDCKPHREHFSACLNYRKTKDMSHLEGIIDWEKDLMSTRLNAERQNTTWQFRDTPPEDFNAPLPEFLAKRQKESLFCNAEKLNK